jgi:hypothetical protein
VNGSDILEIARAHKPKLGNLGRQIVEIKWTHDGFRRCLEIRKVVNVQRLPFDIDNLTEITAWPGSKCDSGQGSLVASISVCPADSGTACHPKRYWEEENQTARHAYIHLSTAVDTKDFENERK